MKVKICGITQSKDLEKCEGSGADLIGFINVRRSKRYLDVPNIKTMVSTMQHRERAVMVLETDDLEEVIEKIKKTGIRTIQLHSLTPDQIKYLKWIEGFQRDPFQRPLKVIRAIGLSSKSVESMGDGPVVMKSSKKKMIQEFAKTCDALLFDYQRDGKSGGTGKQIPLEIALKAVKIAKSANKCIKIFLAGGINLEMIKNNKNILEKVFDYIDVNSGVEDTPGIKNHHRVQELLLIKT